MGTDTKSVQRDKEGTPIPQTYDPTGDDYVELTSQAAADTGRNPMDVLGWGNVAGASTYAQIAVNSSGEQIVSLSGSNVEGTLDAAAPTKANLIGGKYISADPTFHDGDIVPLRTNVKGEQMVQITTSTATNGLQTRDTWTPLLVVSDGTGVYKALTVPANKEYRLISIREIFVASATVGSRYPTITIDDGTNIIYRTFAPAVAASQSKVISMSNGYPRETSFDAVSSVALQPLPYDIVLPATYRVVLSDNSGVDLTGDQTKIYMLVLQRSV